MSEEEDILKEKYTTLKESELLELFQILYNENLFGLLTEKNYNLGKDLLETKFGIELNNLSNMGLRFSIDEHLNIVSEMLELHEKQSDFWKLVVKLIYVMLSIERNPFIANDIEDLKHVIK